jgi:hypothetical protein
MATRSGSAVWEGTLKEGKGNMKLGSGAFEGAGLGAQTAALLGALGAILWAINGWWLGRRHDAAAQR